MTKIQISSFKKTVSVKQGEQVDKRLKRLGVLRRDYDVALNKDVLKREGLKIIGEIEKLLAN